jgi:hypothetical protein
MTKGGQSVAAASPIRPAISGGSRLSFLTLDDR